MKHFVIILLPFIMITFQSLGQTHQEKIQIENLVKEFALMGEQQDAEQLNDLLHDEFRIVMNQLFGSKEVSIMTKQLYLQKIKDKEFGGDKKTVVLSDLSILGNNASAKVQFKGEKTSFTSLIHFVRNIMDEWKLIEEIPVM